MKDYDSESFKAEPVDYYKILKKRRTTLEEWLEYHNINSVRDFNENADRIAKEYGCYISDEMREAALPLAQARADRAFEKVVAMSKPPTPSSTKKKKKNSSNDNDEMLESETSVPSNKEEASDKETLNEGIKS